MSNHGAESHGSPWDSRVAEVRWLKNRIAVAPIQRQSGF
jgi:hypothetical protein